MRLFNAYGRFVTSKSWVAIGVIVAITALAVVGFSLTEDKDPDAFLPDGSELVVAQQALDESFPGSAGLEGMQIIFRGDVLTPEGLATVREVTESAASDTELGRFVDRSARMSSPGHLFAALTGDPTVDLRSLDQAQIDATLEAASSDEAAAEILAALESTIARDDTGVVVGGVGVFTVNSNGDADGLEAAQLGFEDQVDDLDLGELDARTFSKAKTSKDSDDAATSSTLLLMLVALGVIALLLVLFYRTGSDVALSMGGLVLTIVWALGFQGLLGPGGLGLIGAPSDLGTMVPVMMVGLCVDYGIQGVSRYREMLATGSDPQEAMSEAVAALILPLGLAGGTTIISFLTNLFGDIPGLADFGVVAAAGVGSGLFIFLTFNPAVKSILDGRRSTAGRPIAKQLIGDAIPGAGALIERLGVAAVRRPGAILIGFGIVTVILGGLAANLESSFSSSDFVPKGSESSEDLEFLTDGLGGKTEPVTVVIEGDLSDDRTIRNLIEFEQALNDPVRRPEAVVGEVTESLGVLGESLSDQGRIALDALFANNDSPLFVPAEDIEAAMAIIEADDPARFVQLVSYGDADRPDRTLLKFNALTGDGGKTGEPVDGRDQLWFGAPSALAPIAPETTELYTADSDSVSRGP
ncbi:MAG: MMPL family transporter, partial [Actinomycetia bacterium]|nr:MMPL family transporter [Actinomycetes bacterium]